MTNLTDEGLMLSARNIVSTFQPEGYIGPYFEKYYPHFYAPLIHSVFSQLQQVRDAAKKEEREKVCLHIRGKFSYYGCGSHTKEAVSEEIITAIRQMDGGK